MNVLDFNNQREARGSVVKLEYNPCKNENIPNRNQ